MRNSVLGGLLVLTVLAGCETLPVSPPPDPEVRNSCGARALRGLIGQPARVLATMKFSQPVRILRPGDVVTMDYSPDRLNIDINRKEIIADLRCG